MSALSAQLLGVYPGRSLALIAQVVAAACLYPFVRREGVGGLLLASALSLLATFLVATQAFYNYYAFAAALLAFAALVFARAEP